MSVNDIIDEQDVMKAHEHQFILWPRQWSGYVDTHNWKTYNLNENQKVNIPDNPGIYSLLIQPGIANHPACSYLMYIGKTTSLRRRFSNYLNERKRETGRPKIFRILNKYKNYMKFCYTIVDEDDLETVENNLLIAFIPPNNDQFPVQLRPLIGAFR